MGYRFKNPFAFVIWAHLQSRKTKKHPERRLQAKLVTTQILHACGFSDDDIAKLFRFIDWVMVLPEAFNIEYVQEVKRLKGEKKMPYVTSFERIVMQEGIQQGMQQGMQQGEAALILRLMNKRFDSVPASYRQRVADADAETLLVWGERILDARTLDEVFVD